MSLFDIESIHQKYLNDLVHMNEDKAEEIKNLYESKRKELENGAKTDEFIPVLVFRDIKRQMENR